MQRIKHYFPLLNATQINRFEQLAELYYNWNNKVNVISRKDIGNFYEHHVLHSLAIAKIINFTDGTKLIDVGTGGGFPGIPLAIMFENCNFTLIDSIGKKIMVVNEICKALELNNVEALQCRVEHEKRQFDFVLSRAVTRFDVFRKITRKNISKTNNNILSNGILYLKGGEFSDEIAGIEKQTDIYNIADYYNEPFFETKKIIHYKVY